jgi:site-specific DNA-cytosine methylase
MRVLSLFDGVGGGIAALKLAGINVKSYHASEVDPFAIKVCLSNHPEVIHIGDVRSVSGGDYDLILAGSPCQGFSYAGKGLNFNDERSSLYFEFSRILSESKVINPNVKFMLENVRMKKDWELVISNDLMVEAFPICASVVSPFKRNRLYWFNWLKPSLPGSEAGGFMNLTGGKACSIVGRPIDPNTGRRNDNLKIKNTQCIEVQSCDTGRCVTTVSKDSCVYLGSKSSRVLDAYGQERSSWRNLTIDELSLGHGYPKGYFDGYNDGASRKAIGNGWSLQVVSKILKSMKKD